MSILYVIYRIFFISAASDTQIEIEMRLRFTVEEEETCGIFTHLFDEFTHLDELATALGHFDYNTVI